MVQIPYELEQEEDGTWAAHASFPSGGAHGLGSTPAEAVADLDEAVSLVIEEFYPSGADDRPGRRLMPPLPVLSCLEVVKVLEKHGFEVVRVKGSHHMLRNAEG